jgi:hypothetical protein
MKARLLQGTGKTAIEIEIVEIEPLGECEEEEGWSGSGFDTDDDGGDLVVIPDTALTVSPTTNRRRGTIIGIGLVTLAYPIAKIVGLFSKATSTRRDESLSE